MARAGAALEHDGSATVIEALGSLRDAGVAAAAWAPRVATLAADADRSAEVREAAVRTLGALRDSRQTPVLIALLRREALSSDVVTRALEELLQVRGPDSPSAWSAFYREKRPDRQPLLFQCDHSDTRWVQRGLAPLHCPACGPSHPGCGRLQAALTERTVLTYRCACAKKEWRGAAVAARDAECPFCKVAEPCSRILRWEEPPTDAR